MIDHKKSIYCQTAHLLIVDDELNVRTPLRHALSLEGYRITEASSGDEALSLLEQTSYQLMILDMYMPGIGGVEVMQQARQRHPTLPIIILTGRASLESAITAVKVHAADYLLKPIGMRELVTAVRKVLERQAANRRQNEWLELMGDALDERRGNNPPSVQPVSRPSSTDLIEVGLLSLDRQKRLVTINDFAPRQAELSQGEEAILVCLMEHVNQVLSCRRLAHLALGYKQTNEYDQMLIRPYISRLRKKMELSSQKPSFIGTVRGRGYVLIGS